MNAILRKQIEEIVDTAPGSTCRVIVLMEPPEDIGKFLHETTKAVAEQRQAISARSLAPPPAKMLIKGAAKPTLARLAASASPASARTLLAGFALRMMAKTEMKIAGRNSLKPLIDSEEYKKAIEKRPAEQFPIAGSAAITIGKKELMSLAEAVPQVRGVFPSRFIRVPPVKASAAESPRAVEDNKGHTWGVSRTGALSCWGAYGARGTGVKVAVLDTGFDPKHPDLTDKLLLCHS